MKKGWSSCIAIFALFILVACTTPQRCEEGIVMLRLHIDETGNVTGSELTKSSGYPALDNAAITASKKWRFGPARKDGKPVAIDYPIMVKFQLRDKSGKCGPIDPQNPVLPESHETEVH